MNKISKLINKIIGKKTEVEKTPRELIIEKIKTIEATEPETITTMIPACKNCIYCIIYDQNIPAYRGRDPKCNRPTGHREIIDDEINGTRQSIIERNHRKCIEERNFGELHPGTSLVFCGKDAIFLKEKV